MTKEEERIQKLLSCNECKFATCEQCEISYTDKKLIKEYISKKEKEVEMLKDIKEIAESKVTELSPIRISKNKSTIKQTMS
mgnify:FL=1